MILNLTTSLLRLFYSIYTEYLCDNNIVKNLTIVYAIFQVFCFIIESYMVFYFYETGMKFVRILKVEENISIAKARWLFGLVAFILFMGKVDYYIDDTLEMINAVYFEYKYCDLLTQLVFFLCLY
jgi:hypothetical protein